MLVYQEHNRDFTFKVIKRTQNSSDTLVCVLYFSISVISRNSFGGKGEKPDWSQLHGSRGKTWAPSCSGRVEGWKDAAFSSYLKFTANVRFILSRTYRQAFTMGLRDLASDRPQQVLAPIHSAAREGLSDLPLPLSSSPSCLCPPLSKHSQKA